MRLISKNISVVITAVPGLWRASEMYVLVHACARQSAPHLLWACESVKNAECKGSWFPQFLSRLQFTLQDALDSFSVLSPAQISDTNRKQRGGADNKINPPVVPPYLPRACPGLEPSLRVSQRGRSLQSPGQLSTVPTRRF